jgi:hypothetical protein
MERERDWRDGAAESVILGGGSGPLAGFGRRQADDGGIYWEKC